MKRFATSLVAAAFAVLVAVPVVAQERDTPPEESHAGTSPAMAAPMAPGMKPGAMPMMDMCRQMMGDSPGMGAMGDGANPKHSAHMLEMRGEMMKAMGDIMMKHARRMRGTEAR